MRRAAFVAVVVLALSAGALPVMAQAINVTLNGQPVQFTGTRPMVVSGRVLVPLRGVLEQMGAFVGWDPASRTVYAQKSGTSVELPIGSRTATVNGQQVTLDVPAQIVGGSTMVPLRFLSEALGADVSWNAPTRTVVIATGPSQGPPPGGAGPGAVSITSFTQNATGWLRGGSSFQVTMEGTPGGVATFEIPGVVDQAPMRETTPGHYVGRYTVPAGSDITVSGANVIGLLKVGGTQRYIQAASPISIDTTAPRITNLSPDPNTSAASARPTISATFDDAGSGVSPNNVTILVNGAPVTQQATITRNFFTYRPDQALPVGSNTVTVTVQDQAGNVNTQRWTFSVRGTTDVITSFTHSSLSNLQPGDVITVRMQGTPGATASFSIVSPTGAVLATRALEETSPGIYTGEYTVRRGQDINGATITGTLTLPSGQTYTTTSEGSINLPPGALAAPTVTAPVAGRAVSSPLTVTGTAPPNSRVSLTVGYETTVLNLFTTTGVLSEQTVDVDASGRWRSTPINLTTLVRGQNTRYTITAVTLGPNGEESQPTVVTVGGS